MTKLKTANELLMMFIKDSYNGTGKPTKKTAMALMKFVGSDKELQSAVGSGDNKAILNHKSEMQRELEHLEMVNGEIEEHCQQHELDLCIMAINRDTLQKTNKALIALARFVSTTLNGNSHNAAVAKRMATELLDKIKAESNE